MTINEKTETTKGKTHVLVGTIAHVHPSKANLGALLQRLVSRTASE